MGVLGGDARDRRFQAIFRENNNTNTLSQRNRRQDGKQGAGAIFSIVDSELSAATGFPFPLERPPNPPHQTHRLTTDTTTSATHMGTRTVLQDTQLDPPNHSSSSIMMPESTGLGAVASTTTAQSTFSITTQVIIQTSSSITRDHKKDTPLIIGSVIGVVALLSILIIVIVCLRRYCRSSRDGSGRRSSTGPEASESVVPVPYTVIRPRPQGYLANKLQAEGEQIRSYPSADVDHQEVRTDGDNNTGRGPGWESVIASDDYSIGRIPSNPPPSYTP